MPPRRNSSAPDAAPLSVLPGRQGQGIGTALLRVAMAENPCLALCTFQRSQGARRFYEAHGFVAVEETDGAADEEREPDVLYRWRRPSGTTGRVAPG